MDSSESPVHGEQEGAACPPWAGHFACVCYHPIFVFNQLGDCEGAKLRPGNVHSAHDWEEVLEPIVARYERAGVRRYFRADAVFARPEICEYLEEHGFLYAIKLPGNDVLAREDRHLMEHPIGRPPRKPGVRYHNFWYQARNWDQPRRAVANANRISENPGDSGLVPNAATLRSRNTTGCQLSNQTVHPHVPIHIQGKDEPHNFGPFRIHCQAVTLFVVVVAEGRRTRWPSGGGCPHSALGTFACNVYSVCSGYPNGRSAPKPSLLVLPFLRRLWLLGTARPISSA